MPKISCTVCHKSDTKRMMRCCECNEFVCLDFDTENPDDDIKSHISQHCVMKNHYTYRLWLDVTIPGFKMECGKCKNQNILFLNYAHKNDLLIVACNQCISTDDAVIENLDYYSLLSSSRNLKDFISSYLTRANDLIERKAGIKKRDLYNALSFSTAKEYNEHFKNLEEMDWKESVMSNTFRIEISVETYDDGEKKGYCFYCNSILPVENDDTISFIVNGKEIKGLVTDFKKINNKKFMYVFNTTHLFNQKEKIIIRKDTNAATHDRRLKALNSFALDESWNKRIKDLVYNPSNCDQKQELKLRDIKIEKKGNLNDSQVKAIEHAINNRLTLITGPPGTGKTRTIAEMVNLLRFSQPDQKILITSDSNAAVLNASKELKKLGVKVLRHICGKRLQEEKKSGENELDKETFITIFDHFIKNNAKSDLKWAHRRQIGSQRNSNGRRGRRGRGGRGGRGGRRGRRGYGPNTIGTIVNKDEEERQRLEGVRMEYRDIRKRMFKKLVQKADVVCCTSSFSNNPLMTDYEFKIVIVDEASQMTEPSMLIPLNLGCEQLIILGDAKQLPPFVSENKKRNPYKISMFKRLSIYYPTLLLNVQYRSHPEIAGICSELFYNESVSSDPSTRNKIIPSIQDMFPNKNIPIQYVYHKVPETEKYCSFYNQEEIKLTGILLEQLRKRKIKNCQIGIISPYQQHKTKMVEYLVNNELMNGRNSNSKVRNNYEDYLEVGNIDSFQGKEKDIIILNCVRSNTMDKIGFMKSKKRTNVALSRARCAIFIIGNPDCYDSDIWRDFHRIIDEKGLFVESRLL